MNRVKIFIPAIAAIIILAIILFVVLTNPVNNEKIKELQTVEPVTPIPVAQVSIAGETVPGATNESNQFVVSGSVVDEQEAPYPDAAILIKPKDNSASPKTIAVDTYSRFELRLAKADYIASATAPGALLSTELPINPDTNKYLAVILPRARQIAGTIVSEASEIIPNASIAIFAHKNPGRTTVDAFQPEKAEITYTASSNVSGNFIFAPIWPGNYYLQVSAAGYLPHEIQHLQASNQPVRIVLKTLASLHVLVLDDVDKPVAFSDVSLQVMNQPGLSIKSQRVNAEGETHFDGLATEKYVLTCTNKDYVPNENSQKTVDIQTDSASAVLRMNRKGFSIEGMVIESSTNQPVADFAVGLQLRQNCNDAFKPLFSSVSDANGKFRFENVQRGDYIVTVDLRKNKNSSYCVFGYPEKTMRPRVILTDKNVDGIVLPVIKKAVISGRVFNAAHKPVAGATVTCESDFLFQYATYTETDENGRYALQQLKMESDTEIKNVTVSAFHEQQGYGYNGPVECIPGAQVKDIDIILKKSIRLSGRVTNKDSVPIPKATLEIMDSLTGQDFMPTTDENGYYEIASLPRWDTVMSVGAIGYLSTTRQLHFEEHEDNRVGEFCFGKRG